MLSAQSNLNAEVIWSKTFGGPSLDGFYSSIKTSDNKLVMLGYSNTVGGDITHNNGSADVWVVKTDLEGNIEWQNSYGGSDLDVGKKIIETQDGGYILLAETKSNNVNVSENKGLYDIWVVKLSKNGNIEWQKSYGGSDDDRATSIAEGEDGYMVVGYTLSDDGDVGKNLGNRDAWIFKIDKSGNLQWSNVFGGSKIDSANDCIVNANGEYVAIVEAFSTDGDIVNPIGKFDTWLLKYDKDGNLLFKNNYGGTGNDHAYSINLTSDGGYAIAGYTDSSINGVGFRGFFDFWFSKISADNTVEWQKTYGGADADYGYSVKENADGTFYIAGGTTSSEGDITNTKGAKDAFIAKLDKTGNIIWNKNFGGTRTDDLYNTLLVDDGIILIGRSNSTNGDIESNNGMYDGWMLKIAEKENLSVNETLSQGNIKVYPNPAKDFVTIEGDILNSDIQILSSTGRLLKKETKVPVNKFSIELRDLPKGIYFLQINQNKVIKVIKN